MKMYALFDTIRNKYYRSVYDGREDFTVKPYEMTSDRSRQLDTAKRLMKNWKICERKEPVPKFQAKEFDVAI